MHTNQTNIASNTADINSNTTDITTNASNISTLQTKTQYITTSGGDTDISSDVDIGGNRLNCGTMRFINTGTGTANCTFGMTNATNNTCHLVNYSGGYYAYCNGNITLIANGGEIRLSGTVKFDDDDTYQNTAFTDEKDAQLATLVNTASPTGSVIAFAGSSAPTGWLLCDGSEVSKTTYADLFAVIGTTYDATGGRTAPSTGNFCLPDLRQCMIMGAGGNTNYTQKINWYSLAKSVGQFSEMSVQGHGHNYYKSGSESAATGVPTTTVGSNSSSTNQTFGTVYDDGTSFTEAITQPNNVGMHYIIKT